MHKLKDAYLFWYDCLASLPKTHRYSIGQRIDHIFIESIEFVSAAAFLSPQEKVPYIRHAIRKIDTLKVLLLVLWETKSLDYKKYITLSEKIDEIGRMLGGWNGQLSKQNSSRK
ncbi:MAG: four helix bundle protein [Candidatus Moraniibacteriota bacterium]